jgi:hypothetical protein
MGQYLSVGCFQSKPTFECSVKMNANNLHLLKQKQIIKEGQVLCYIEQLGGELPIEVWFLTLRAMIEKKTLINSLNRLLFSLLCYFLYHLHQYQFFLFDFNLKILNFMVVKKNKIWKLLSFLTRG